MDTVQAQPVEKCVVVDLDHCNRFKRDPDRRHGAGRDRLRMGEHVERSTQRIYGARRYKQSKRQRRIRAAIQQITATALSASFGVQIDCTLRDGQS